MSKVLKIREKNLSISHPSFITTYNNLGIILNHLNKKENSQDYFRKALRLVEDVHGKDHPMYAQLSINTIPNYDKENEATNKESLEKYSKILETLNKKYNGKHPEIAKIFNNIGVIEREMGKLQNAEKAFEKALQINIEIYGDIAHPSIAACHNNLGLLYEEEKKFEEALQKYRKAMMMFSTTAGDKDARVAQLYQNMGHIKKKQKDYSEAEKHFKKSLTLYKDAYDPDHPNVLEASKYVAAAIRRSSTSKMNESSLSEERSDSPRRSSFFQKFADKFLKKRSSQSGSETAADKKKMSFASVVKASVKQAKEGEPNGSNDPLNESDSPRLKSKFSEYDKKNSDATGIGEKKKSLFAESSQRR
eukprot:CAMPEP_0114587502 /NCGR_PEP_ID=MMETSP0125-20121206/10449_1 /TAXON_ID=485358 ORGANISM="Aristerostoma sp., Strain ATCC 50986" /NCGR_SAMPLE_ID=MMETSP0125 /ASSEMBLY_ACC=CAM_ASM_000245 /LENGTH=361 /DNA_ID=CAMNT_0001783451 /DNA_START=1275 /DNA_END=2360 /DNA_ORIENTATION=-